MSAHSTTCSPRPRTTWENSPTRRTNSSATRNKHVKVFTRSIRCNTTACAARDPVRKPPSHMRLGGCFFVDAKSDTREDLSHGVGFLFPYIPRRLQKKTQPSTAKSAIAQGKITTKVGDEPFTSTGKVASAIAIAPFWKRTVMSYLPFSGKA